MSELPAIVIDNGTGYSKLGYSGQTVPSYIIPTTYCDSIPPSMNKRTIGRNLEDLDYWIGHEALDRSIHQTVYYPVRQGHIQDWDQMERYWSSCFFKYLRADPEEHNVLLTEPPLNPPENREMTAEVMFETFNVKGIHIAVQAVLAIIASWLSKKSKTKELTGTVVDIGDGVTHIIPVVEGYVISSAIKHVPLAGRNITKFLQDTLRSREKQIPSAMASALARHVKEQYCYVCKDMLGEFKKFDRSPDEVLRVHKEINPATNNPFTFDVGPERFMAPEIFFNPELISSDFTTPLPALVDRVIQACPIDTRRPLFRNIVLSGGSTMFPKFGSRLKQDLKTITKTRQERFRSMLVNKDFEAKPIEVNVASHNYQRYAVWLGGSLYSAQKSVFDAMVVTREDYEEHGTSIMRRTSRVAVK